MQADRGRESDRVRQRAGGRGTERQIETSRERETARELDRKTLIEG